MSYTTSIRSALTAIMETIPVEVLAHLDALDQLGHSALDFVSSASKDCFFEEFTVVDAGKLKVLSSRVNAVRDDKPSPLTLNLTCRDEDGTAVDTVTAEVTIDQVSTVVDVATELVLAHRKGQPIDEHVAQLDVDLCAADIIDAVPCANEDSGFVCISLEVSSDDGLDDAEFGSATLEGSQVLVDFSVLPGSTVIEMEVTYPNANKYGVPETAHRAGAEAFVKRQGLKPQRLILNANDSGDDSGDVIILSMMVPATAVAHGDLDDVREFAGLHWRKDFDAQSRDEKEMLVNRFVQAVNGVTC